MAHLQIKPRKTKTGRHVIHIGATPKSPETRAMLREFYTGLKAFEKKWKAHVAAQKKRKP